MRCGQNNGLDPKASRQGPLRRLRHAHKRQAGLLQDQPLGPLTRARREETPVSRLLPSAILSGKTPRRSGFAGRPSLDELRKVHPAAAKSRVRGRAYASQLALQGRKCHTHHFLPSCIFRPHAGTQLSLMKVVLHYFDDSDRLLWPSEAIVAIGRFSNFPSSSLPTDLAAMSEIVKPRLEARSMYSLLVSEIFG